MGKRDGGFILITVYLLLALLLVPAAALFAHSLSHVRSSQRLQSNLQAYQLAEAGLDWAITQFRNNPLWAGGTGTLSAGNYTVTLQNLGNNRQRVTSQGTANQGFPAVRSVETIVLVTANPLFPYAMFGNESVTLSGNANTDSYNSSVGPYNSATAGSNGDVGTNGISAGNVSLSGNASVNGDVYVGTGGDPNTVITMTGNSTITGGPPSALNTPQPMTPVTVPGGLTNQGNLSISGNNTVTLPGGTYLYSSVSISGNGGLNFTGPVTLYLTGQLSVSGNGIGTVSNLPPGLLIHVQGSGNVNFSGNANFYGAVYAPESDISISGNGAFYGATIGKKITNSGNGGVHYDEALQNVGGGAGGQVQVLSWQDLS